MHETTTESRADERETGGSRPASRDRPDRVSSEDIERVLHDCFGHDEFRPGQERIVRDLLVGRDVLALLPTGAGKSLVFQLASQLLPGLTVVVSPLLALMRDQEEGLADVGVDAAVLNSARTEHEIAEDLDQIRSGDVRLLYVTPERFVDEGFPAELAGANISLLVVDEAHCISEWGHSFRPAYLGIAVAATRLGRPPVLALTATATPWVRRDIVERLAMRSPDVVVRGSDRPNLFLEVHRIETEAGEHRALKRLFAPDDEEDDETTGYIPDEGAADHTALEEKLAALLHEGSGIIYTATTRAARETAEWLQSWGVAADYYHGQRKKSDRERIQDAFMHGDVRVIVATNAFGLGVDKPDVRFVIHLDIPASLEAYYQEAGRAGRDGELSRCLLLYRPAALGRAAFLSGSGQLDREDIAQVCAALKERREGTARVLSKASGVSVPTVLRVVSALEHDEIVTVRRGRIRLLREDCDADSVSLEAEERRRAYEKSRLDMMRGYAETAACRREYILNYFGEEYDPANCRLCDNSLAHPAATTAVADQDEGPFGIGAAVRHNAWGDGVVQRVTADSITVLFEDVGFKTLARDVVKEKGLLEPAGNAPASAPA